MPLEVIELIPKEHICNLAVAVVASMAVGEVVQKYRSGPGNPAYSRRMLLRPAIMASVDGIWSSRKIAKLAPENVVHRCSVKYDST